MAGCLFFSEEVEGGRGRGAELDLQSPCWQDLESALVFFAGQFQEPALVDIEMAVKIDDVEEAD